ncbi:MAG: hypothetical protein DRJ31_08685 [Candidatus Methanomethylicota archaeon]|uniref:Uncharacterized protein n=1 Tax=Thermoproteota archaeon TaxID=2056631 RepID=A0A497EL54_9CREN|nr:MAG: hypothetical protein DRJ31_08685 [Candidatus Verstraetearchaeota archaeon]
MKAGALIMLPLFIMLTASLISIGSLSDSTQQYSLETGNYTVNQEEAGIETETFSFSYTALVVGILTAFVGITTVASVKVFGSGMGETGTKILFICGIGLAVWGVLSALSLDLFMSIPAFGLPIYFGLSLAYVMGIVLAVGGNG